MVIVEDLFDVAEADMETDQDLMTETNATVNADTTTWEVWYVAILYLA
jgi:hypothetical protein